MKNSLRVGAFVLMLFLTNCTSSMEADAAKMAELQCKQMKMTVGGALDALAGKTNVSEIQEHQKEIERFSFKMMEKYDAFEKRQKFANLVREKLLSICL